ncbi:hypothetical protein DFH08DRAFT_810168 [Mycena albidolilacea]|uniref:Uncharacterized protein n=1 Tax=Mycena albidolilacea TaxID=1033008 RepID=A0AAD6ZZ22_9AGAR|nr:hypothetical protein DFH08DRAFT_810168 [Mycena albidolilacea]
MGLSLSFSLQDQFQLFLCMLVWMSLVNYTLQKVAKILTAPQNITFAVLQPRDVKVGFYYPQGRMIGAGSWVLQLLPGISLSPQYGLSINSPGQLKHVATKYWAAEFLLFSVAQAFSWDPGRSHAAVRIQRRSEDLVLNKSNTKQDVPALRSGDKKAIKKQQWYQRNLNQG